jgi:hypothetical protein
VLHWGARLSVSMSHPLYTRVPTPRQWLMQAGASDVSGCYRPSSSTPLGSPDVHIGNLGTTALHPRPDPGEVGRPGKFCAPPPPRAGLVRVKTLECKRRPSRCVLINAHSE